MPLPLQETLLISNIDKVSFRTQVDAMRLFGFKGAGYQRGAWTVPDNSCRVLWFPRFFPEKNWSNIIGVYGETIAEVAITADGRSSIRDQINRGQNDSREEFIVFGKRAPDAPYRYEGTFIPDFSKDLHDRLLFNRIREVESLIALDASQPA